MSIFEKHEMEVSLAVVAICGACIGFVFAALFFWAFFATGA